MGKATIISELGDGRYRVQPEINKSWAVARIVALTDENTAISDRLSTLAGEIATAENNLDYASAVLHAAIVNGDPQEEIDKRQNELNDAANELRNLKTIKSTLTLKKTANEKRISYLQQQINDPAEVDAWCADLTLEAAGVVGTAEIGRRDTTPIIKPGAPAYDDVSDGQIQPLSATSAAAAFWNYAMLPGAAKWKPRYRTGVASNIDIGTDTMDVTLNALKIAGQNCNQSSSLVGVPVEYMSCNARAFADGDDVLVEFTNMDWSTPKVVGFAHDPQPCNLIWVKLQVNGFDCIKGGEKVALRYTNTDSATVINGPQSIPEVGAPLDVDDTITVPADNFSMAGPFDIVDWDQISDIEVLLYSDLSDANRQTNLTADPFNDGTVKAPRRNKLFSYYYNDPDGYNRYVFSEFAWWSRVGDAFTGKIAAGGAFGFQYVVGGIGSEWEPGYSSGWYSAPGANIQRYKVIANISGHPFVIAATLSANSVLDIIETSTPVTPMSLLSGRTLAGQIKLDVSCVPTIRLLQANLPKKYNYRHNPVRTWVIVLPPEGQEDDDSQYSFLSPAANPPSGLLSFVSDVASNWTVGMVYDAANECMKTNNGSGYISYQFDTIDDGVLAPGAVFNLLIDVSSYGAGATAQMEVVAGLGYGTLRPLSTEPTLITGSTVRLPCALETQTTGGSSLADAAFFAGLGLAVRIKFVGDVSIKYMWIELVEDSFIETGMPCLCLFTKSQISNPEDDWTAEDVLAATKTNDFTDLDQPPPWAHNADAKTDRRMAYANSVQTNGPDSWNHTSPGAADNMAPLSSMPMIIADEHGNITAGGGSYSVSENHPQVTVHPDPDASLSYSIPPLSQSVNQSYNMIDAPEDWF